MALYAIPMRYTIKRESGRVTIKELIVTFVFEVLSSLIEIVTR